MKAAKPPTGKAAPKKRNLAAKALRDPLFRPKIMANPTAYKRRAKFNQKPDDSDPDEQVN